MSRSKRRAADGWRRFVDIRALRVRETRDGGRAYPQDYCAQEVKRGADGWRRFVEIRALRRYHHDGAQRETRDEQRAGLRECVFVSALCASVGQSSGREKAAVAHHRTNARVGYQRETL